MGHMCELSEQQFEHDSILVTQGQLVRRRHMPNQESQQPRFAKELRWIHLGTQATWSSVIGCVHIFWFINGRQAARKGFTRKPTKIARSTLSDLWVTTT